MSSARQPAVLAIVLLLGSVSLAADKARDHTSRAPRYTFANDLPAQQAQLRDNPLLQRFRESRQKLATDRYRPAYHFSPPEGTLNDPNGLCFWQGRWHLFYQTRPKEDGRWHWGHAVSDDLIRWRDLPFALYPNPEEQCYSGSILVEKGRAIAMYHGRELGNMVATSTDPLLLNWEKVTGTTVIPLRANGKYHHFLSSEPLPYRVYDPCIFKHEDVYYSLSGSVDYSGPAGRPVLAEFLFRSRDLRQWEFVHSFVEPGPLVTVGDDGACPYFWPIGNRHLLLFFSHMSGGQYLLGDFDPRALKFSPTTHGRFNFGSPKHGGIHAPSATPDGNGGVIAIFNMNLAIPSRPTDALMTLPRRLTLIGKEELGMEPTGGVEALRKEHRRVGPMKLAANQEIVLPTIRGNAMEIMVEIDPKSAPMVELNVLRSDAGEEVTRIALFKDPDVSSRFSPPQVPISQVVLDATRGSLSPDVKPRTPECAPVRIPTGEPFKLRIFIDRSVVEVFVNGRQCVALRVHPTRPDSLGVSLRAQGGDAALGFLDSWQMATIYE